MNTLFNLDGPVMTFLSKFCDLLIVSILWIIFSCPIITIGPATSALYHTVHKVIFQNEGYLLTTFWNSFKSNAKQGIILTLLTTFLILFAFVCFNFSKSMEFDSVLGLLYLVITAFVSFFTCILCTYGFPVLSRFYMKTIDIIKTSIALAVTRFGFTLLLIIIFLLCIVASYIAPVTMFLLPGCYAMAAERLIEPGFKKALDSLEKAKSIDEHKKDPNN